MAVADAFHGSSTVDGPRMVAPFEGGDFFWQQGNELAATRPVRGRTGAFTAFRQGGAQNRAPSFGSPWTAPRTRSSAPSRGAPPTETGPQELVPGPDDRLYGAAVGRGGSQYPTVFAYDPVSGAFEGLWTFSNQTTGPPIGAPVVDANQTSTV
jgi:hypothetical protein